MRIIKTNSPDFEDDLEGQNFFRRLGIKIPDVEKAVKKIIVDVLSEGDQALIELTKEYDDALLTTGTIRVEEREFQQAKDNMDPDVMGLIVRTEERIRAFHEKQRLSSWFFTEEDGTELGQIIRPIERVGVYVPA